MDLFNNIVTVLVGICAVIAALSPVIMALLSKIKDERIRNLAEQAVAFAEQIAKSKTAETKMPSDEKFNLASSKLKEMAKMANLKIKPEAVNFLIESVLGKRTLDKK